MTTQRRSPASYPAPAAARGRRRKALAGLAASTLVALTASGPPAAAAPRATPEPAASRLQAVLDSAVRSPESAYPGVALHVRRPGHAAWSGAAGKASVAPARAMRPGDRFRAGSIMKPFVATAVLQLVEAGRLSLGAPLPAVLPARVVARFAGADRITVRMLLNHTSGIGDFSDAEFDRAVADDPRRRWKVGELLDRGARVPRTTAPGERHVYSNTNYVLLGMVLEQVTGRPWRTVVRERVIERLRLRHTSLPESGRRPSGRGIARGYEPIDGTLRDVTDIDSSMAGAAGGHALLTTTADLSRFLDALLDGRLFQRRRTLAQMTTFVDARDGSGKVGYGLGLDRYVLPGGVELIGHLGTTGGYRALVGRVPSRDVHVAMVMTSPDDPSPVLLPALGLLTSAGS